MNRLDHSLNGSGSHESFDSPESVLSGHRNRVRNESIPALKEALEL